MLRRRMPLTLGLLLVAIVALIWVPPALTGPTVDCGPLDQAACDEVVPAVLAEAASHGFPVPLPVISVSLSGTADCLSYQVMSLFGFGYISQNLC